MSSIVERPWWPSDQHQFREALRHWLGANLSPDVTVRTWWRRLAEAGLTAPTWPRSQGGLAATTALQGVVEAELAAAGAVAPPIDHLGFRAVAPALRHFLPLDRLAEWIEPLLRGEHRWTLLADDVDAASGVVHCRAERDWKYVTIDGSTRTTDPAATHALLVARADPTSTGRRGLDAYVVDLREPGVEVAAGEVRLTGHRVLHDRLVGEPGGAWEVVKFVQPYLERTLAGRIRRGLVHIPTAHIGAALDLTVGEATTRFPPEARLPEGGDRRQRG